MIPLALSSLALARNQLALATILCALFVTGEIIGGYLSGSLAIVGDAAHMFGDLASFGLSLLVLYISDRKSTKRMTYGYHRVEALGALATLCITWYVTGILVYLAIRRIVDQEQRRKRDLLENNDSRTGTKNIFK